MMEAVAVKRIAVLGAGTIGGSWVAWFLARGMQVTVWDPRAEAADFVRRYVADAWPAMARLGMTADASPLPVSLCLRLIAASSSIMAIIMTHHMTNISPA